MDQVNNFHSSEVKQNLDQAFDRLESLLKEKLDNKSNTQYQESIKSLNEQNNKLNQQLIEKTNECDNWKDTYHEVINRLNSIIENIKSILKKEQVSE
ncbi:DUF4164 domain-containing protein [Ehrlichia sp. JZT12]